LEVAAPEGAGTDKDPSQNLATSAARRCDIKLRTVDALPDFFHRSTRVVHSKDIGLWAAQAEEQRRLEQ
jgi:hypothetical protein